jgi:hypothetical protein
MNRIYDVVRAIAHQELAEFEDILPLLFTKTAEIQLDSKYISVY